MGRELHCDPPPWICVLDVCKPTSTHGWPKLIAQTINLLGDGGLLPQPHVICNTKLNASLKNEIMSIMNIIDIMQIISIKYIINIMHIITLSA